MTRNFLRATLAAAAVALAIAGCASMSNPEVSHDAVVAALKSSFQAKSQAGLDRLDQDETQRVCSEYFGKPVPPDVAARLEKSNLAGVKWPADGHYLGDWKNGEKIAQSGQGKQYSDDPKNPSGGNCYACHQLTKSEISYGTIGPSLYQFGKLRGYNDEVRKYAYGKVYNAEAYAACSNMPRFGAHGILTEAQIKDVVALLMDPKSPVNQ
ncbi:MAG TPA: sulfur oxidation c-type cytochrome SoxX [Casimicrobiaceae bacterium]|jgi:sulfur-oxidizing protein SoxX|nr:sulfur oxidation c-type cytochrome SoxX [Casimicrobiaceae bacterium]